ncbi:MAG: type I-C CRISPR-associated endonuclease Cas1c [Niameybacter sp.]
MRHLLNTLFVLTPETYLALENENVVVFKDENILGKFPLHTLEHIMYFGYKGASPALMGECAKRNISLSFHKTNGKFLAKVNGITTGNVLLRKKQYRVSDSESESYLLAKDFIIGKIFNARSVIERTKRDHPLSVNVEKLKVASKRLLTSIKDIGTCSDLAKLRGIEGEAAKVYFSVFDELILQNKTTFKFAGRVKRPPLDNVNALLSFVYTILALDCATALEAVGLDAYVGFLHRDRPGRISLALDLMEELRCIYADRFVLTMINNRMINSGCFMKQENGAIILNDTGRKTVLTEWQNKKREIITHPFLGEKIAWGLITYVQALLLARYLRGDLERYPAFLWK